MNFIVLPLFKCLASASLADIFSHHMKSVKLAVTFLVLELLGIVALFLPFTHGTSPWKAAGMIDVHSIKDSAGMLVIVSPFFYSLPILGLSLRLFFRKPLKPIEVWGAYSLGILGSSAISIMLIVEISRCGFDRNWGLEIGTFVLSVLTILGLVLAVNKRMPRNHLAQIALRCGYFVSAFSCLGGFSDGFERIGDLEIGAGFVAATIILYLIEVVYFSWQGFKSISTSSECKVSSQTE